MKDHYLLPWKLACGVSQGSVLSSILFNVYTSPLTDIIWEFWVSCHLYANDIQLYLSIPSEWGEAVQVLNYCLEAVIGWMWTHKLKRNLDKSKALCIAGSKVWETASSGWGCTPWKKQVQSLWGVYLLSPEAYMASSAYFQFWLVHCLWLFLGRDSLATVIHVLITYRLSHYHHFMWGCPWR